MPHNHHHDDNDDDHLISLECFLNRYRKDDILRSHEKWKKWGAEYSSLTVDWCMLAQGSLAEPTATSLSISTAIAATVESH